MTRNALGRGLEALIRQPDPPVPQNLSTTPDASPAASGSQFIDIDLIEPSPFQPRTHFGAEALSELARSILATGIIQPLVVRRVGDSRYQLLAGERRWRAAQQAGLPRVPAVIRNVPDEAALEITLVENIQREDLNPVEEARAFDRMMSEFNLTHEDVAARTGKNRTTVVNATRLLRLERPILDLIEEGRISAGHGRALLAINDPAARTALSQRAARGEVTVRQLERLASRHHTSQVPGAPPPPQLDPNTRSALEQLQRSLGTRVTVRTPTKRRPGELVIEYYDEAQLIGLYDRLIAS